MASPIHQQANTHKIRNSKSSPALNKVRATITASEVPGLRETRSGSISVGGATARASSTTTSGKVTTAKESLITSLGETSSTKESAPSASRGRGVGKAKNKVGFFRKLSLEWNLFVLKLRSISDEVFLTDEVVENLFDEEENDFDRPARSRIDKSAEDTFIASYKHFKSLDKMAEHFQSSNDVRSSTTDESKSFTLQDIIRQSESEGDVAYSDLDICKLRQEFEAGSTDSNTLNSSCANIGITLWEYRRKKWLRDLDPSKSRDATRTSIEHIPKESYVKIYTNLVEKGRTLKQDKRLNLSDLITVIDAGWIAEERWERAAKGLA